MCVIRWDRNEVGTKNLLYNNSVESAYFKSVGHLHNTVNLWCFAE
jgi:hypothetical protein